jgi:hypothetical protein
MTFNTAIIQLARVAATLAAVATEMAIVWSVLPK